MRDGNKSRNIACAFADHFKKRQSSRLRLRVEIHDDDDNRFSFLFFVLRHVSLSVMCDFKLVIATTGEETSRFSSFLRCVVENFVGESLETAVTRSIGGGLTSRPSLDPISSLRTRVGDNASALRRPHSYDLMRGDLPTANDSSKLSSYHATSSSVLSDRDRSLSHAIATGNASQDVPGNFCTHKRGFPPLTSKILITSLRTGSPYLEYFRERVSLSLVGFKKVHQNKHIILVVILT